MYVCSSVGMCFFVQGAAGLGLTGLRFKGLVGDALGGPAVRHRSLSELLMVDLT